MKLKSLAKASYPSHMASRIAIYGMKFLHSTQMCTQICVETHQRYKRELTNTAISSQRALSMIPEYIHNCDSLVLIHVELLYRINRKGASISKHANCILTKEKIYLVPCRWHKTEFTVAGEFDTPD